MNESQILEKLTEIIRTLFDEYEGPVTRTIAAKDIEQWDSLANVQLIVLMEKAFGVRFTMDEIARFENLGSIIDRILKKG